MREYALVLLVTAAVTYLLTPLVRRVAIATGAMHEPRARDTHTQPTPLLGGLAMYGGRVAEPGRAAAGRRTRRHHRVRRRPVGAQRDQQAGRAGGRGRHPGLERPGSALAAAAERRGVLA